jgi:hypothetical protein
MCSRRLNLQVPYPNTTEAGFMKVNDNAGSQRVAE